MNPRRSLVVLLALPCCLAACADDVVPDPRVPFGPMTETLVAHITGTVPLMDPATAYDFGVVGEKEIGGKTWKVWKFGHDIPAGDKLSETTPGTVVWVDGIGTDTLTLGGFGGQMGLTAVADAPVTLDLHPPVGEAQTASATGTVTSTNDPVGKPASISVTYTLVEDDATVTTRHLGDLSGVRHFQGNATVGGEALPGFLQGKTITGDIWYHPDFGVVDARSADLGFDLGVAGENDWGEPRDGAVVGRMLTVLDADTTTASFSTYDRTGTFDADMCVHAKMLAEVRWANEADAKTRGEPDPTLFAARFNGGMGTFCWGGCPLVESPASIFHPEDNGKGYRFWYAFVDEALKNEVVPGGDHGSAYSIEVTKDPSLPPIRVTMRIGYAIVSDDSDCSM